MESLKLNKFEIQRIEMKKKKESQRTKMNSREI